MLPARRERAVLVDKSVRWAVQRPQRKHIVGGLLFGTGWAVADACPGPIATQLGQGIWWRVFTIAGLVTGLVIYLRGREAAARTAEPDASPGEPSPATG